MINRNPVNPYITFYDLRSCRSQGLRANRFLRLYRWPKPRLQQHPCRQTPVQAPAQAESPPTPIQAQAKSPATPLQAIVQQTSPPKQAPPTPSAAGTPNSQTSNQSTPGTSAEVSLLQAKINELEKQLAAKAAPPKEVPCQTPQNRIRSKGHPSPAPTSAREAAPAPAADANTAEDLDEEEEDEQEGQSKIMVTSPDGTIES